MRFSLATLFVSILWIATGLGVWMQPVPWQKVADVASLEEVAKFRDADTVEFSAQARRISETNYDFRLNFLHGDSPSGLSNVSDFLEALPLSVGEEADFVGFRSSKYVILQKVEKNRKSAFFVYTRRYPKAWWGHFYRPEVWVFAALTVVLVVRAVRARRRLRTDSPGYSSPQDMK